MPGAASGDQPADRERDHHLSAVRGDSGPSRLHAAEQRDAVADERDVAAAARDLAALARDHAMTARDTHSQHDDDELRSRSERVVRAAGARKRAMERRAQAAEYRVLAAHDRRLAEQDREQAALERRRALVDREALARELQRERDRADEALRHQRDAQLLAGTLQRSLSPPGLPRIAGLDVAAHYEPFSPDEVGGDFYDLLPLGSGRTGFFQGDVCGKGPEAAAVTSLARYTLRTAALLRRQPDAILRDLNATLQAQSRETMQMCTAVYGAVDVSGGDVAVVTLAVAGHPAPLIVRAHGAVEAVPARGTVLGAVADPAIRICEVRLAAGDTIVIHTDGILGTVIDAMTVDEQRVAGLLFGVPQASAQTLVDRLAHALRRIERPLRDDVAVLALQRTTV